MFATWLEGVFVAVIQIVSVLFVFSLECTGCDFGSGLGCVVVQLFCCCLFVCLDALPPSMFFFGYMWFTLCMCLCGRGGVSSFVELGVLLLDILREVFGI